MTRTARECRLIPCDLGRGCVSAPTGRQGWHPSVLLKLFNYGYLHRLPFNRRSKAVERAP
ncbi:hypothetical protein FGG78_09165 [Thioclava sp. BHET1]|nr:hypothetical protein FGG78_09165 [Thioclava sp. BHET1]